MAKNMKLCREEFSDACDCDQNLVILIPSFIKLLVVSNICVMSYFSLFFWLK